MNLFLDSSALVKRYLSEEGATLIRRSMSDADHWLASQLTFVECLRAVSAEPSAGERVRSEWPRFQVLAVSQSVCERAVDLAGRRRLRSLDAIQLASAMTASHDLTFATFDRRLHAAARAEGLTTLPASLS